MSRNSHSSEVNRNRFVFRIYIYSISNFPDCRFSTNEKKGANKKIKWLLWMQEIHFAIRIEMLSSASKAMGSVFSSFTRCFAGRIQCLNYYRVCMFYYRVYRVITIKIHKEQKAIIPFDANRKYRINSVFLLLVCICIFVFFFRLESWTERLVYACLFLHLLYTIRCCLLRAHSAIAWRYLILLRQDTRSTWPHRTRPICAYD